MNLEHLGDSLDYWKGEVFRQLRINGWLQDFAVEPMISDEQPWNSQNIRVYRHLLSLEDSEPVFHKNAVFSHQPREAYFTEITHRGDLFLDPDNGITTGEASVKHVCVEDIHSYFRGDFVMDPSLLVFQHAGHDVFANRIKEIVKKVISPENNLDRNLYCCSYECGKVAMLFFSVNRRRMLTIPKIFSNYIGSGGRSNIKIWSRQLLNI